MNRIESEGLRLGENVRLTSALEPITAVSCLSGQGSWVLSWCKVDGAVSYEVHTTTAPAVPSGWAVAGQVSNPEWRRPAFAAADLWVRVRAVGVTGAGPWSEPVFVKNRGASARMAA